MKIGEYIGAFGTGGIEHVVFQLFHNMDHKEEKIDFLIDFQQDIEFSDEIYQNNGRILSLFNSKGTITKYYQKVLKTVFFYKLLRMEKYDIIHIHISYPSTLLCGNACRYKSTHCSGSCSFIWQYWKITSIFGGNK